MASSLIIDDRLHDARILIVDDEEPNVRLLIRILQKAGFSDFCGISDPRIALDEVETFRPDLVILDLHMPWIDGFTLLDSLQRRARPDDFLPVLVLTADITPDAKLRALSAGAHDFLSKPFDSTEVLLRIRSLLEIRRLHGTLAEQNRSLELRVRERTRELEEAKEEVLQRLALAAEYRDDATGEHTRRVGLISSALARRIGMDERQVELVALAAPLHDIGKIGVPDQILMKGEALDRTEQAVMMSHVCIGARILSGSEHPVLRIAEEIASTHHEWWDGTGYPNRLKGEEIPISGRLVALADVFDALLHLRPYKERWVWKDAVDEIRRGAGTHFDPRLVEAFLALEADGTLATLVTGEDPGATPQGADDRSLTAH